MDKILRPDRFDSDPYSSNAARDFKHWYKTFTNYLNELASLNPDKIKTLANSVSSSVYEYIDGIDVYDDAIARLREIYVKTPNEIFARHILATRSQQHGESINTYVQSLRLLSRDCNFKPVTGEEYRNEAIRDAFITGLYSNDIRQRLLEKETLTLKEAIEQARSLELAQTNSERYDDKNPGYSASSSHGSTSASTADNKLNQTVASSSSASVKQVCFFCGNTRHPRFKCPARNATCNNCGKHGHFSKVCKSSSIKNSSITNAAITETGDSVSLLASVGNNSTSPIIFNDQMITALIDSGSCESFVSEDLVENMKLDFTPVTSRVSMASSSCTVETKGFLLMDITLQSRIYRQIRFSIMPNLCHPIILGRDFLKKHKSVEILFDGKSPSLSICGLSEIQLPAPKLFSNLSSDCKPIATQSRRFNDSDKVFIRDEVNKLLREGVIETSNSPWRAQVLVVANERHRKRMVVDYSRTINKFTYLDAYPLPKIDELVRKISTYSIYSTLDLTSAYYQIAIKEKDKPYTAFEADGNLYQFRRLPFGVTNGVACFQRLMDDMIRNYNLHGVYAYLDNLIICGKTQEDHDLVFKRFMEVANQLNLTFNETKSDLNKTSINFLGYTISNGTLSPDKDRLEPLLKFPEPQNIPSLRRLIGLFSYYSSWIPNFSERIRSLAEVRTFPLSEKEKAKLEELKNTVADSMVHAIDEKIPFTVETDASDHAIAATLNQAGRPVAFFSRKLSASERKHSSVEKEAYAIVEALRKWRHFLIGRRFTLLTDQKSVSFMFDSKNYGKIKNDKILRWRIDLACFDFDIVYRPGKCNAPADALSRICGSIDSDNLERLHQDLCHPGMRRMHHFVKVKNLPYSMEDVRKMISRCKVCAELKPNFYKPPVCNLIKATQPFERLNIDFKGPLPSSNKSCYILTVIDEYSRFPFAFPCADMRSSTVIRCLSQLFTIFGLPAYIHSDRGASFLSSDLTGFLNSKGVATSRTTPYNPKGNAQCERFNGIIWKSIKLCLRSRGLSDHMWTSVLGDALHSIRSLLCTATNETPHERMFGHPRRSMNGSSTPSWLSTPGKVLLRRHVRTSKQDPLVDEVDLVHANPQYALVRFPDGREDTFSTRDLAPTPDSSQGFQDASPSDTQAADLVDSEDTLEDCEIPRRSTRVRKPPERYGYS